MSSCLLFLVDCTVRVDAADSCNQLLFWKRKLTGLKLKACPLFDRIGQEARNLWGLGIQSNCFIDGLDRNPINAALQRFHTELSEGKGNLVMLSHATRWINIRSLKRRARVSCDSDVSRADSESHGSHGGHSRHGGRVGVESGSETPARSPKEVDISARVGISSEAFNHPTGARRGA
jgi:hypothetical protein